MSKSIQAGASSPSIPLLRNRRLLLTIGFGGLLLMMSYTGIDAVRVLLEWGAQPDALQDGAPPLLIAADSDKRRPGIAWTSRAAPFRLLFGKPPVARCAGGPGTQASMRG